MTAAVIVAVYVAVGTVLVAIGAALTGGALAYAFASLRRRRARI